MKTIKYLSMAALAFVGTMVTGCSSDDGFFEEVQQQGVKGNGIVTLSTTVSMDGDETRALTENGVKTFAVGEQIAVIYTNSSDQTVKAVSYELTEGDIAEGSKSANFTVTLDNPKAGTIKYVYPAAMANDDGTMASISTQDGTLESLSQNLDYCFWSGEWDGTALPESKKLGNQLAICKFTVMSIGGNDVTSSLSSFSVSDGTNTYNVTPSSLSTIYLAMLPVNNANLTFTLIGSDIVEKKVNGKTLEAGKMYPITLSLAPKSGEVYYFECSWNGSEVVRTYKTAAANNLADYLPPKGSWEELSSGVYYVSGNLSLEGWYGIKNGSKVDLVLCDGAVLELSHIVVDGIGSRLRVFGQALGTGTLKITPSYADSYAGIGAYEDDGCDLEFHGGIIIAQGPDAAGSGGPAIGSGDFVGVYKPHFNSITIYGGSISAVGGNDAAGIGGNQVSSPPGYGDVYIYGGTVTAQGGEYAAGIGGGDDNHIASINIYGGTVNAYAGTDGAGIGGGEDGDSGNINIYGGTVYAYGGKKYDGSSNNGYGAGIGSGQNGNVNNIKIYGGNVHAYGGMDAAGIGTGEEYGTDINSGTIEIHGGSVYAEGKGYGVGIGAGEDATFGVLGISGGRVDAHSDPTYSCGNWSGAIGAYHSSHSDGCHIGWAGWQSIYIGKGMRLWTYSPSIGYVENVTTNVGWWGFIHERPQVAIGVCDHPGYTEATCPFCYRETLQVR